MEPSSGLVSLVVYAFGSETWIDVQRGVKLPCYANERLNFFSCPGERCWNIGPFGKLIDIQPGYAHGTRPQHEQLLDVGL